MQITVISDTHGLHDRVKSLNNPFINEVDGAGKMIVHAGDITEDGSEAEVRDFLRWFAKLPASQSLISTRATARVSRLDSLR